MADTTVELIAEGKDITSHLTDTEEYRFGQCEQIIRKGLNTFLTVGQALAEIRDRRLYREAYPNYTFEKYCKEVWDISKGYVSRQIHGYETVNYLELKGCQLATFSEIPTEKTQDRTERECDTCKWKKAMANKAKGVKIGMASGKCTRPGGLCEKHSSVEKTEVSGPKEIILPMNEAQTRPLTKLKNPDDQVKAWEIVLKKLNEDPKAKLTAALISKAVKEVRGEVVKRNIDTTKKAIERTSLVSVMFKKQFQVMLDIVSAEQNAGWPTCSKKEAVRWLENLVKIAESDD